MSSRVVAAAAIFAVAGIVAATSAADRRPHEDAELHRNEVVRLRAHFDSVLAELSGRSIAHLRPAQLLARTELVRALAGYRDAGVFPHNHDFAGTRVPYFRDEHGTLCAVAYLVASTGRDDVVDAVAARRNNAYVPDLATDPALRAWLDSVGLTVAEAARIQPTYGGGPVLIVEERPSRSHVLPSVVLGATALVSAAANWGAPRERKGGRAIFVGALSGAAVAILGAAILSDEPDEEMRALGVFDVAAGSAALAAAVRRSIRRDRTGTVRPPIAASQSRVTFDVVAARYRGHVALAPAVKLRF